jgi:hypothetical protein
MNGQACVVLKMNKTFARTRLLLLAHTCMRWEGYVRFLALKTARFHLNENITAGRVHRRRASLVFESWAHFAWGQRTRFTTFQTILERLEVSRIRTSFWTWAHLACGQRSTQIQACSIRTRLNMARIRNSYVYWLVKLEESLRQKKCVAKFEAILSRLDTSRRRHSFACWLLQLDEALRHKTHVTKVEVILTRRNESRIRNSIMCWLDLRRMSMRRVLSQLVKRSENQHQRSLCSSVRRSLCVWHEWVLQKLQLQLFVGRIIARRDSRYVFS